MQKFLPLRYLNFFLRVGFICNLCFVAGLLFRILPLSLIPDAVVKTLLILGFVVALPLNLLLFLLMALLLIFRKIRFEGIARWLFFTNLLILFAELGYFMTA